MYAAGDIPGWRAKRVCRKARAQGYDLRANQCRRHTALRLRLGDLVLAGHCGINLLVFPERQAERRFRCDPAWIAGRHGASTGG